VTRTELPWWTDRVGYEVYLRSFADSDGDGVGDLTGLHDHLDYLAWLGVGIVWITPFYPSPMRDHGYDVADYRGVDPSFGSMADLEAVFAKAHDLGMKVLVDLVPNHSSSEHPWFTSARTSKDSPYRDYYIWRDPAPGGGPPNNWTSHFGGSAWTLDETTGQYWCHLFLPEQPDLNWANPAVADEFDEILRFWLARGADGFRIDVAHALVKHPEFLDNPPAPELVRSDTSADDWGALEHLYDANQPGVLEVYRRWRKVVEPHDGLLLGEVYVLDAEKVAEYVRGEDGLHLGFWFKPLHLEWEPDAVREVLVAGAEAAPGLLAWVSGSHDRARAASRFGGGDAGRARALALSTLLMGLPGTPFLFQGEELGLENGCVPREQAQDPVARRTEAVGRDGARTPLPWAPGPGWGFTDGPQTWLPMEGRTEADTVAVQRADPSSMLHRYRALIALRDALPDLRRQPVEWVGEDGPVVAYRRGDAIVAANCGGQPSSFTPPDGAWVVVFSSNHDGESQPAGDEVVLAAHQAVVLTS
jgi:alpha-glucosidase